MYSLNHGILLILEETTRQNETFYTYVIQIVALLNNSNRKKIRY